MLEIILFAVAVVGALILGIAIGKAIGKATKTDPPVGILYVVDDPDPRNDPYVCSEFYENPRTFRSKKYVTFEVNSRT